MFFIMKVRQAKMLLQASRKLSEEVQKVQTTRADSRDQTPRNVSDALHNLTWAFLRLAFALLAHFGFVIAEPIPFARDSV